MTRPEQKPPRDPPIKARILSILALPVFAVVIQWIKPNLTYYQTTRQPTLWLFGLIAGTCVGIATIGFRELLGLFQLIWLQDMSEFVATAARKQPWWVILITPTIGGLIVGIMLEKLMIGKRALGVPDVIAARAQTTQRLSFRQGIYSALISATSLGFGASSGREGPVVHLGATISTFFSEKLGMGGRGTRIMLACGVASAVSASFNAPIAGVLFAHEVILGHYAASAFVPIVISSVAGTVISRLYFGETAAFIIPDYQITSYWEFPAFALLGVVCALVAIGFQATLVGADWTARHINIRLWMRPVLGGLLIGFIAMFYPEILGVGYEATNQALHGQLTLTVLISLLILKTVATAITLASRFGGGVFSPALYLGAMTGGAFGLVAAGFSPDLASSGGVYAILGMGAVAASVIGAPISTVLIVFELTGGYTLTIALLITIAISHGLTQALHGRSFFHWQLEMRGLFVQEGPHKYLGKNTYVGEIMRPLADDEEVDPFDPGSGETYLRPGDTLETALRSFDTSDNHRIPVVDPGDATKVLAFVVHVDVLSRFNSALINASEEEHR
ncbi:MAG: chloride channel protein [Hyphomicrobiales bacterium]